MTIIVMVEEATHFLFVETKTSVIFIF